LQTKFLTILQKTAVYNDPNFYNINNSFIKRIRGYSIDSILQRRLFLLFVAASIFSFFSFSFQPFVPALLSSKKQKCFFRFQILLIYAAQNTVFGWFNYTTHLIYMHI